ncbi:hypothetical protein GCM10023082_28840 [Streptomyces tremellae]|uniref:Uncharacterized protein n=1 Tax=Streptomyces tremellae TaxID=1124239 RepID=A0ABP7F325_9ACTN
MISPTVSVPASDTTDTLAPSTRCTTARMRTNLSGAERVQIARMPGARSGTMQKGGRVRRRWGDGT